MNTWYCGFLYSLAFLFSNCRDFVDVCGCWLVGFFNLLATATAADPWIQAVGCWLLGGAVGWWLVEVCGGWCSQQPAAWSQAFAVICYVSLTFIDFD